MKIMKLVPAIAGILFAQSVSVRGPELTMSGSTISHARTDGNTHVPRSFGVPDGYQLTTHGGSGDAYWAAPGGAFVDSARASGLSDSAKALVRYARTAAVHDTADSVRKYARDRIKDSLVGIRAALPAYVRRIGDTITGPIVGTTATAAPLINITTTFGNLANAAIRGTATAANGSALHGVATGANGIGVWGSSTGSTGDGGLFYGANGSNALRAYAVGSGDAGRFEGNVKILGTATLASSLTGILKANAGVIGTANASDIPGGPYLPLAGGNVTGNLGVINGVIQANTSYSGQGCLYGNSGFAKSATNYSLLWVNDGSATAINGSSATYMSVGGNAKVIAASTGVTLYNTLTLNGYQTAGFLKTNSSGIVSVDTNSYLSLAGGTMNNGASIAFSATGDVRFTAYGVSGMFNGNADNATYSAYNLKLKSWWGIGFESYDGVTRTVLDTRTGNLSTLGSIGCAGLAVTGTLSATSTLAWGGGGAIGSSGHVVQGVNDTRSTNSGSWTSVLPSGFYDDASAGNTPSGSWCYMINTSHTESGPGNQYQAQLATNFWGDNMWFRRITSGSVGAWRELWHSGNLTSATLPGGPYVPLTGVTDGSSASSGIVGEIISASASGTSFTGTSAGVSLVSISLPAGSWLVWGSAHITNGASPLGLSVYLSYSPTGTSYINANTSFGLGSPVAYSGVTCHNAPTPINSSSTATVYLIGSEVTTGAVAVNTGATIYAQRIR